MYVIVYKVKHTVSTKQMSTTAAVKKQIPKNTTVKQQTKRVLKEESDYDSEKESVCKKNEKYEKSEKSEKSDEYNYESESDSENSELDKLNESNESNESITEEDIELTKLFFNRCSTNIHDFNILLIGKVSSGKTTLLNALLGDCYSESKIQKTTKGISLYLTNCNNFLTRDIIFSINKSVDITDKTTNIPFNIFQLDSINVIENYYGNKNINIFDTVGIDDPDAAVNKMTHKWIKKNSSFVDVFIIVTDIKYALTTKSDTEKLKQLISDCKGHIIFAANKFDDNESVELDDLYTIFVQQISTIMEKYERSDYDVCHISALNEYIMKLIKFNKIDRLTTNEKKLGQIITTSGFGELYKHILKLTNLNENKQRIFKFLKRNMLNSNDSLLQLFTILNNSNQSFSEEETNVLIQYVYNHINTFNYFKPTYQTIELLYPKFDKHFSAIMKLKKMEFNNKLFKHNEIQTALLEDIIKFVKNAFDPNEKNMILNCIFNKEIDSIKKNCTPKKYNSFYGTNLDHYNRICTYGKLICTEGKYDIINETLISFINLLVTGNILCETVSANIPTSSSKQNKKITKTLYRTLLHFLFLTTNEYVNIFSRYRSLIKLKYVDGEIGTHIGSIDEYYLLDLNLDNIDKQFEYFEEIKRISDYLELSD